MHRTAFALGQQGVGKKIDGLAYLKVLGDLDRVEKELKRTYRESQGKFFGRRKGKAPGGPRGSKWVQVPEDAARELMQLKGIGVRTTGEGKERKWEVMDC